MPCCAFAACIVAQLLLGARAVKQALLGHDSSEATARNLAVEWRLGSVPSDVVAARRVLGLSLRGLAVAAAFEVAILFAAIYGIVEHIGHGAGHAGPAHSHQSVHALHEGKVIP